MWKQVILYISVIKNSESFNTESLFQRGLVVGVYDSLELTKAAEKIDNESGGKVKDMLNKYVFAIHHCSNLVWFSYIFCKLFIFS